MGWMQNKFEKNFLITTVDYVFNWARKSAVWPMTFGLACCAIEMIASDAEHGRRVHTLEAPQLYKPSKMFSFLGAR